MLQCYQRGVPTSSGWDMLNCCYRGAPACLFLYIFPMWTIICDIGTKGPSLLLLLALIDPFCVILSIHCLIWLSNNLLSCEQFPLSFIITAISCRCSKNCSLPCPFTSALHVVWYRFIRYCCLLFFSISYGVGCTNAETLLNKGNNKITELRTILQRESQNS